MLYYKETTSRKLVTIQEKTFGEKQIKKENTINEQIKKEKETLNKTKIKKDINTALGIGAFSAFGFGTIGWTNGGVIAGIICASVACISCAGLSFAADSGLFDNYDNKEKTELFAANKINAMNLANQPLPIVNQPKSLNI